MGRALKEPEGHEAREAKDTMGNAPVCMVWEFGEVVWRWPMKFGALTVLL